MFLSYQINNLTNDSYVKCKLKYILDVYKFALTEKMQSIRTTFLGGKLEHVIYIYIYI